MKIWWPLFLLGPTVWGTPQPATVDAETLCLVPFDEIVAEENLADLAGFTEGFRLEPASVPTVLAESRDGFGQAYAGGTVGVVCLADLPSSWELPLRPELTIDLLLQPDLAVSRPAYLMTIGPQNSPGSVLGIYLSSSTEVRVVRYADGEWRDDLITLNQEVPEQIWTHFALVLRSGEAEPGTWTARVFLDGREAGRAVLAYGLGAGTPDSVVQIGGQGPGAFAGLIDDFRISAIARFP